MPKIDLSFAELHTPLFLANINYGVKLYNKQAKGELDLVYEQDEKELWVTNRKTGDTAIVPTPNVVSMTPKKTKKEVREAPGLANQHATSQAPKGAQVSTPHDHVFAQAPGKTRD